MFNFAYFESCYILNVKFHLKQQKFQLKTIIKFNFMLNKKTPKIKLQKKFNLIDKSFLFGKFNSVKSKIKYFMLCHKLIIS